MTRVLIVDDELESRTRLRRLLQAHGHAVTEATNGLEALKHARQQPPDLVISDILMPQMDGFALCRASRTDPALARTPFVFYTGTYASAKDVARARRLGATRFLAKSIAAEDVIRAITETLRQPDAPIPGGVEPEPDETESWRLYDESLINTLEHRNLELADEVRTLRSLTSGLEQLPAIVSLTDTRGRITFVNRRFEDATGFTRDMVRGQTQAGGHVGVEHTSGDGTTVLVLLPRSDSRPVSGPRDSAETAFDGTERILLVEDEPALLELMRRTLASYGYTVLHASTPERAVRAMQEGAARVDLLLTDVVMPGINGRELAMRLRAGDPALRVLFMSGYSSDVIAEHGLLPAEVSLIIKPFSPTALAARVREVLDAPAPTA